MLGDHKLIFALDLITNYIHLAFKLESDTDQRLMSFTCELGETGANQG